MGKIIHHNVEPYCSRICCPQALEGSKQVRYPLVFMDRASQAIPMDVIESQKLFGSRQPTVRRPQSDWLLNACPVLTMNRPEFQGSPFVKTKDRTVLRNSIVEFKNAVFFSRTPDPETVSMSSSAERTDPRDEASGESIRC
jgi:hypothetical protein